YSMVTSGMVRRSLVRVCRSRSKRRGSSGARCTVIFRGAAMRSNNASSSSENEFLSFSDTSQLGLTNDIAKARTAATPTPATDSASFRRTVRPQAHPDCGKNERGRDDDEGRQHQIEAHEAATEGLQHFGGRVAGNLFPYADLEGSDEAQNPGADREREHQD